MATKGSVLFIRLMRLFALAGIMVTVAVVWMNRPKVEHARHNRQTKPYILNTALDVFKTDNGRYPTTAEGLDALVTCPPGLANTWRGPYLGEFPQDKWEQPYRYAFPDSTDPTSYDLYSVGSDGVEGTEDDVYYGPRPPPLPTTTAFSGASD